MSASPLYRNKAAVPRINAKTQCFRLSAVNRPPNPAKESARSGKSGVKAWVANTDMGAPHNKRMVADGRPVIAEPSRDAPHIASSNHGSIQTWSQKTDAWETGANHHAMPGGLERTLKAISDVPCQLIENE